MTFSTTLRRGLLATIAAVTLLSGQSALAQDVKPVTPALDFSGVILANYRYASDSAAKAGNAGNAANKFDVERVYLNFRMPAGDDGSIRVSTDVFNNTTAATNGYYPGWTIRLKYAYFQYNFLHDIGGEKGFNATARIGMLHTTLIDHEEGFWPRWVSQVAAERNGFFSSSDVGVAGLVTLPNKWGEIYASIANGPGYGAAETDRFKDMSARISLTPFGAESGFLKTFTISPWAYLGSTASKFQNGGTGQVGTVSDALNRNRYGVFAGIKDRRFTAGAEFAQRTETIETGANTAASARGTYTNSGTLTSAFVLVRPFEIAEPKDKSPLQLFARLDNFKPYSDQRSATGTQTTSAANQQLVAGIIWDLNQKTSLSLDIQNLARASGSQVVETNVLFLHLSAAF